MAKAKKKSDTSMKEVTGGSYYGYHGGGNIGASNRPTRPSWNPFNKKEEAKPAPTPAPVANPVEEISVDAEVNTASNSNK